MKHELTTRRKERRIMGVWTSLVLTTALFTTSAFAADSDPLTIVNNLSDFIFSCIKAIGIIILGWGCRTARYVGTVARRNAENAGRPVSVRRSADCVCKGNSDGNRRGLINLTVIRNLKNRRNEIQLANISYS